MSASDAFEYRDAAALVRWTTSALRVQLAITCVALATGYLEYEVLVEIRDGAFASPQAALAAAHASDARARGVGILQTAIYVGAGILSLWWIHRASWNARALGARNLAFTPRASVAWYFVPVANLWMPYRAMKELWRASRRPAAWSGEAVPSLVRLWWLLWLVESVLGNASFRMSMTADDVGALIRADVVTLLADLVALPLCLVFLALVRRIQALQEAGAPAAAGPVAAR